MNKTTILNLMSRKFDLEESNIADYQKIRELKRNRLKRIVEIDKLENEVRIMFDRIKIKRGEIR